MGTTKKTFIICNTESSDHMCHAGRDLTFYISIVYALKNKMTLRSTAWHGRHILP